MVHRALYKMIMYPTKFPSWTPVLRKGKRCHSCSTRCIVRITNVVMLNERENERNLLTETNPWSSVSETFLNNTPNHDGTRDTFCDDSKFTFGSYCSVASLLAATLCQGNPYRKPKLWITVITDTYIFHIRAININEKFSMVKLKIHIFVPNRHLLSISRYRPRYQASLVWYIVSFFLNAMGYINIVHRLCSIQSNDIYRGTC